MKANLKSELMFSKFVEDGLLTVTKKGLVFNTKTRNTYKAIDSAGYYKVSYNYNGKLYQIQTHRLVWIVHKGLITDSSLQINHKDGNKRNNNLSNLELVSNRDNTIHAIKNKLLVAPKGEQQGLSKFTDKQVIRFRKKFALGSGKYKVSKLALKYDVSVQTMSMMLKGQTYKHLKTGYEEECKRLIKINFEAKRSKIIDQKLITEIKKLHLQGFSSYAISEKIGIARNTVMKYW